MQLDVSTLPETTAAGPRQVGDAASSPSRYT
jgi:hypothetical protein